jgi:hypothetical protein
MIDWSTMYDIAAMSVGRAVIGVSFALAIYIAGSTVVDRIRGNKP